MPRRSPISDALRERIAALDKNCEFEIVRRSSAAGSRENGPKRWTVTIKIERSIRKIRQLSFEHGTLAIAIQQAVERSGGQGLAHVDVTDSVVACGINVIGGMGASRCASKAGSWFWRAHKFAEPTTPKRNRPRACKQIREPEEPTQLAG